MANSYCKTQRERNSQHKDNHLTQYAWVTYLRSSPSKPFYFYNFIRTPPRRVRPQIMLSRYKSPLWSTQQLCLNAFVPKDGGAHHNYHTVR